jgi:tripartite-type tricarboxylate transporter receptor subunit TctC
MKRQLLRWAGAGLMALGLAAPVLAQAWPDRPVRVVLPYPPGGPSDIVIRAMADKMQATLKQPLVVENRSGAGGNLGAAEVARAAPDGYTWLWTPDTVLTVNPHIYRRLGFDPEALVPVTVGSVFSQTLVCNRDTGVSTVAELMNKARREKMSYASGGAGVPGHLAMELLLASSGVQMLHIPYRGPGPATQDVIGGQEATGHLAGPTVLPHVRSGRLVALAVSGARRSPVLPEVPTVAESGVAGYDATFMLTLFAVKGTPAPIVEAFHKAMVEAVKDPAVMEILKRTDQEALGSSQAEARRILVDTSRQWGEVARRINLSLD